MIDCSPVSRGAPSHDERAWLLDARPDHLRRRIARFTRDAAAADDIVQDATLRLVLELRAGNAPENPAAWLRRVATNLAVGRARHLRVTARWSGQWHDEAEPSSPEALVDARERVASVRAALAHLSEADRAVLLRAADGDAAGDGRSALALRSALCRARGRLRAALARL